MDTGRPQRCDVRTIKVTRNGVHVIARRERVVVTRLRTPVRQNTTKSSPGLQGVKCGNVSGERRPRKQRREERELTTETQRHREERSGRVFSHEPRRVARSTRLRVGRVLYPLPQGPAGRPSLARGVSPGSARLLPRAPKGRHMPFPSSLRPFVASSLRRFVPSSLRPFVASGGFSFPLSLPLSPCAFTREEDDMRDDER